MELPCGVNKVTIWGSCAISQSVRLKTIFCLIVFILLPVTKRYVSQLKNKVLPMA